MLHLQAPIAGAPCGWPSFLSGSVLWSLPCGVHSGSEFPFLGWGGRPGVFSLTFPRGGVTAKLLFCF